MILRKGSKTKNILESSIESALLAVEIYNKPRTSFRVENYIMLMILAWTKLLHAHFNNTIGDKYYIKDKSGKYVKIDGEKKTWEISRCIKKYEKLSPPEKANLELFIRLRNKIEHRHVAKETFDILLFGECQALLYNYEKHLVALFGEEYSINENLAFSLQFSKVLTKEQREAQKKLLSTEVRDLVDFIEKYKSELTDEVFNSQEYSIKLIAIPKVANSNRNDLSVEFIPWDSLNNEEREEVKKLNAIIKDKIIKVEALNTQRYKPKIVVSKVVEAGVSSFNSAQHTNCWKVFTVRPPGNSSNPFETISKFCLYDEPHGDYLYTQDWIDFLVQSFRSGKLTVGELNEKIKQKMILNYKDFE